jgi:hypothetical protein
MVLASGHDFTLEDTFGSDASCIEASTRAINRININPCHTPLDDLNPACVRSIACLSCDPALTVAHHNFCRITEGE